MKKYKAIFFDWDGTAVLSRQAPVDDAIKAMSPLLDSGVKLVIVSGTTYENIAGGRLESFFTAKQLENLYLGLGRGAYNYAYKDSVPYVFKDMMPDEKTESDIHRICFDIHMALLEKYRLQTDIVFSRPNYCKIDLSVDNNRGDNLFMQDGEVEALKSKLETHGMKGGLKELIDISVDVGNKYGIKVKPTCDAKYLEVGTTSKSDNVKIIYEHLNKTYGIVAEEISFWGDEFVEVEKGIFGSDSFMYIDETKSGDFFDVSPVKGARPEGIKVLGGGIKTFLDFLREQNDH